MNNKLEKKSEQKTLLIDMSDIDEVRKAFVASEILNRKY